MIAPNTYYAHRRRGLSRRALWDITITEVLAGYYEPDGEGLRRPESLYGSVKMWAHLNRQGIEVAKCTVERLMGLNGWAGVTRRVPPPTTTIRDPEALEQRRPPDLVDRQFRVAAPNVLWVADFTYVMRIGGLWCYTAFTIDAFADAIVGWEVSATANTAMVEAAFAHAVEHRARQGHPSSGTIHHSDAGSQYTAIRFAGQLAEAEFRPSIGSVGDSYDNALAECINGLYKCECVPHGSPFNPHGFHTVGDVEAATGRWVHWFNTSRLLHRLGRRPPAEAEAEYYAQQHTDHPVGTQPGGG